MSWPSAPKRLVRISAALYNRRDDYPGLAGALGKALAVAAADALSSSCPRFGVSLCRRGAATEVRDRIERCDVASISARQRDSRGWSRTEPRWA